MKTLMLSFGIGGSTDRAGRHSDGADRRDAAFRAAFELGPAWHGGQTAIFLKTAKPLDEVYRHLLEALDDRELLMVIELTDGAQVKFAGLRFDEEGFDEIFPSARELQHINQWAG